MRSDSKIPPLWTIINWRQYIEFVWYKYVSWHKRNFIKVKCLKCWLESEIESKWFYKYWCKCVRLEEKKWKKHWFQSVDNPELHRFYNIFCWIKRRCSPYASKESKKRYYDKWIKCERESFERFKNDMRESYKLHIKEYWIKNTSIDRIDWSWNYNKSNCRRATCKEQSNNTKLTIKVEIDWKIYWSQDISNITWISMCAARERLKKFKKWIIDKDKLFFKK
jgi:hypothetical protein